MLHGGKMICVLLTHIFRFLYKMSTVSAKWTTPFVTRNRQLHSVCHCPYQTDGFHKGVHSVPKDLLSMPSTWDSCWAVYGNRRTRHCPGSARPYSPGPPTHLLWRTHSSHTLAPPKPIRWEVQERKKSWPTWKISTRFVGKGSQRPTSHLQLLSLVLTDH